MTDQSHVEANRAVEVRPARLADLVDIQRIYNEGIADRAATLDTLPKDEVAIAHWFAEHNHRYQILAACGRGAEIVGWASLNRYSPRAAYDGVAYISIYIARASRGRGVGTLLLSHLIESAISQQFHKLVLFTFPVNEAGQKLYRRAGFREVGTFRNHGKIEGKFMDVIVMEKLLLPEGA